MKYSTQKTMKKSGLGESSWGSIALRIRENQTSMSMGKVLMEEKRDGHEWCSRSDVEVGRVGAVSMALMK